MKINGHLVLILVIALLPKCFSGLSAQETGQKQKLKLAVLRITYDAFTEEEKQRVNQVFYDSLGQDVRISVVAEAEAREKLIPFGIEPSEINNEQGYIGAGRLLEVDYLLIGTMDKIGDFVEVTFRTFKMPSGTHKRYPGGKTLDMLVKEEIPNIVNLIYDDLGLEEPLPLSEVQPPAQEEEPEEAEIIPPAKVGKKPPWALIALGGVAGGAAAFFLASSGGGGGPSNGGQTSLSALPRPPNVP